MFRTIERHEERSLGLPYAVVLENGAEEEVDEATGEVRGVSVINTEGLVAAVAVSRALHPLELDGREIRFIRRVIGMTAKAFAEGLGIDPATLSRWENNKQTVGDAAHKSVRMAALVALRDRVPHIHIDPLAAIRLQPQPRQPDEWPLFVMRCQPRANEVPCEVTASWDTLPLAA